MSRTKDQWIRETGGLPLKPILFANLVTLPALKRSSAKHKVVFDIETDLISREFNYAKGSRQRISRAPKPSLACAYSDKTKKYYFFDGEEFNKLLRLLRSADEVITFNGEKFDFFVLARKLKLTVKNLRIKISTDLYRVIKAETGKAVSLNNLAIVNLGKPKHTFGNKIPKLDMSSLKKACKSDVSQTLKLYKLYSCGKLQVPLFSLTNRTYKKLPFHGVCPVCKDVASIVQMEWDAEQMTEGQLSHYLKGDFGTLRCATCNSYFTWESA